MRIGVFDSGIGGEAIASALDEAFAGTEILQVSDRAHMPYGTRTPAEVLRLTAKAIQPLLNAECDVIVIACNTATATALPQLRLDYPDQLFIGLEPMVKTAAELSRSKIVAVCATPTTLASASYKRLKRAYGARQTFVEPDCSDWAMLIENNEMNSNYIDTIVNECIAAGADVIVLGCTHYHWIKGEIVEAAGDKAIVIEPSEAIADRVRGMLDL
jgi:glutamate racemase